MTADAETATRSIERWLYAGTRLTKDGRRVSAWCDPEGALLHFGPQHRSTAIGATLDADYDRGTGTLYGSPVFVRAADHEETRIAQWELASKAAELGLARARAEKNAVKVSALDQAMQPLRDVARKARTRAEREALVAYVIRELGGVW